MWCRLITGEKSAEARPISWQHVGQPQVSPELNPPGKLYSDPAGDADYSGFAGLEQRIAGAYQKGLRDGESSAERRMSEQVSAQVEQLARSIEQLAMHRARIQREAEPELVKLSLAIARRILRRELTVDPESLLGLLKAGLEKIDSSEVHRIRVHPEHAPILRKLLEGAARTLVVEADPGLPVGAVVVDTSRGSLDTGLETQLKEIERGFADVYPR
jgi:flagellar assembly protein FliH